MGKVGMVWQALGGGQGDALGLEHGKKGARAGNGGHGFYGLLGQGEQINVLAQAVVGRRGQAALQRKRRGAAHGLGWLACVQRGGDWAWPGFAQRASGQQPAVADAVLVENAQLNIPGQRQVLQAIVADDDVGGRVVRPQGLHGLDALAGHKDRCAGGAGQQGGLVTHFMGGAVGQGLAAIGGAAAIAARDNARLPAVLLQIGDHGLGDGGFASPASNHIAHDDDGHPGVDGALAAGMPSLQCPVQLRKWPQQAHPQAPALPWGALATGGGRGQWAIGQGSAEGGWLLIGLQRRSLGWQR